MTGVSSVAIFVNAHIFKDFINGFRLDNTLTSWDYQLQIGSKIFEMKLILLPKSSIDRDTFFYDLVMASQFSMPWLDNLTLFSDLESYHKLEEFIEQHRLKAHFVSINDQVAPTLNDHTIKVVTFSDQVDNRSLIRQFGDIVKLKKIRYFYFAKASPWLQPNELKPITIQWKDHQTLHLVLPLILHHLSSMKYRNELDIFDLISLKLAICDFPVVSNHLSNEIDYFISRTLREMVRNQKYLNDTNFDLTQYLYDRNVAPSYLIENYFLYEFQKYVRTVQDSYDDTTWRISNSQRVLFRTIILAEQSDIFRILDTKSNVRFTIDGNKFSEMNFGLFSQLLGYSTIREIILDTEYAWINNEPQTDKILKRGDLKINFVGGNAANFIEDFVSSLKTISYTNKMLDLTIIQTMSNYTVFDTFTCESLNFRDLLVDNEMLDALSQCNVSHIKRIRFSSCRLENRVENWELYHRMKSIQIQEDESTWQYLFEFIAQQLEKYNEDVFTFDRDVIILYDDRFIRLNMFSFRFDEYKSKLEMLDEDLQPMDVYDSKHWVMPVGDKCNYEFYQ